MLGFVLFLVIAVPIVIVLIRQVRRALARALPHRPCSGASWRHLRPASPRRRRRRRVIPPRRYASSSALHPAAPTT